MTQTHMAREVAEIPGVTARFLRDAAPAVAAAAAALRATDPNLVVTVARGSSDHAATYLKYAIELLAGIPVASVGPSVASVYGRALRLDRAACIGISQSGQSPDIVEMMRMAKAAGALSIGISNNAQSPMGKGAAHCLDLGTGAEQSVAATKTFSTSVVAGLALLAEWTEDAGLRNALADLPGAIEQALMLDWSPLADRLTQAGSAFVLGRGPALAIAGECALKLKETCSLHAEAYSAAEVLHGPSAIVTAQFPVLVLGVDDAALPHVLATASRLADQGANVFATGGAADGVVALPSVSGLHPLVAPLVLAVTFHAFVEALSRRRGYDPDTPPHLRKVTETM